MDDILFDSETIERATVPRWKFWILPLIHPRRYRQVRWLFTEAGGRTHKFNGLLERKK